jgi:hypothetical protein
MTTLDRSGIGLSPLLYDFLVKGSLLCANEAEVNSVEFLTQEIKIQYSREYRPSELGKELFRPFSEDQIQKFEDRMEGPCSFNIRGRSSMTQGLWAGPETRRWTLVVSVQAKRIR